MLQFIKIQYKLGRISADKVRSYVPKWLTAEQAAEIIGEECEEQVVRYGMDILGTAYRSVYGMFGLVVGIY